MQYIVQMSGVPGSGKSTIARSIGSAIHACVLDHDDTKSAIMSTGISSDQAGRASYEVIKVLVRRFAESGKSVVIDSPCLYQQLLDFGESTARELQVTYCYVECILEDFEELTRRIQNRTSKPSQNKSGPLGSQMIEHQGRPPRNAEMVFREWAENMKRPERYCKIDTSQPLEVCLGQAIQYVKSCA